MSDLEMLTNELMQDEVFNKPEIEITKALTDARINANMTQKELSKRSGITQADISRLERGNRNPSLALLKRLAEAMDTELKIEFVPKQKS